MNSETQKLVLMKIFIVSGIACLAWMFLVKPATQSVQSQRETVAAHKQMIVSYKETAGNFDSQDSLEVLRSLEDILSSMSSVLSQGDSGTALHNLINETAGENQVSVSRIETIKEGPLVQRIKGFNDEVHGIHHLIRVEFEGEYGSVIKFMDEIVSTPVPVKFTSFRIIPIGTESVRVKAEISSVMLTSIPSGSEQGGSNHE